ncbi:MAG: hypothetical protein ABIF85_02860 [Nanoarchaeota archaeon]|nr:hypothetical protein [Nanoarchaeota archaeon]MBU4300137.1 hypothetical protein [Nanoarchaeota archaeon]MBU4451579.1 hypothetical protein [Nanoarchaeota archaeon]MCG2724343.1 hypothetical protein [archaeon]
MAQTYREIAGILPSDAVLNGPNKIYAITPKKLKGLSNDAKNMLTSFGMVPKDEIKKIDDDNNHTSPVNITITPSYIREHYGE